MTATARIRHLAPLLVLCACATGVDTDADGPDEEDFADDPGAGEPEAPVDAELRQDLAPGDIAEVGAAAAVVPQPGDAVFAEALLEDGGADVLVLETDDAGAVWQLTTRPSLDEGNDEVALQAIGACSDGAHSLFPWRWNATFQWRYFAATTPTYLSAGAVEDALRRGTRAITMSRNDCGLADQVSATALYLGRTARPMSAGGPCGGTNGESSVGFGELRPGILAITCTYARGGVAVESDLRFNGAVPWYATRPAGCTRSFSIAGVTAHERGHTFVLGHASPQVTHAALTMSPGITACTDADLSLGLGDVRGLRKKY
jgi:hypothetical protein